MCRVRWVPDQAHCQHGLPALVITLQDSYVQSTLGTRLGALLAWITCPCHYIIGLLCVEYAGYQTRRTVSMDYLPLSLHCRTLMCRVRWVPDQAHRQHGLPALVITLQDSYVQSTLGTRLGALLAWITCPCHYIVGLLCAEYAGYQARMT